MEKELIASASSPDVTLGRVLAGRAVVSVSVVIPVPVKVSVPVSVQVPVPIRGEGVEEEQGDVALLRELFDAV